jgi:uncharacterized membrane protein YccC
MSTREAIPMTTAATARPLSFVGVPVGAWAFGIRIWLAVVVGLLASFWLELEAPSSAAITVAILAAPTRGQVLDKTSYRAIATLIGVAAAIAITALFSQARDLLLVAFAGWIGLCVYAAGLLDGNRAYAAVLSGYTVALIAIQQIDTPEHVFETGMARGAAIAVGIAAVAVVNDLLAAPDSRPQLASQLAALHRRVREYAKTAALDAATDTVAAVGLLRNIAALRPEMASVATESASGSVRIAAARSTAVALVAEVYAARAVNAAITDQTSAGVTSQELQRRDVEVSEGLSALKANTRPLRVWRTPLFRSQQIAVAAGIRAALCLLLPSAFFVLAGWPASSASLSLLAIVIGLGATKPDPKAFTVVAFIVSPIAAVLAGTLEFLILDGVNEFVLLALALAPLMIGATALTTRSNPLLSSLGRLNLIFILAIFAPSNPPAYNPQAYLFTSLFLCVATALLLMAQIIVPAESNERRQGWLMESAQRDFEHLLSGRDRRLAPEEAMYRDATRIGQITSADNAVLAKALSYFDRAASIRLCRASLVRLAETSLSQVSAEAQKALAAQDTQRLRELALTLRNMASAEGVLAQEISGELAVAAVNIDGTKHSTAHLKDRGSRFS